MITGITVVSLFHILSTSTQTLHSVSVFFLSRLWSPGFYTLYNDETFVSLVFNDLYVQLSVRVHPVTLYHEVP